MYDNLTRTLILVWVSRVVDRDQIRKKMRKTRHHAGIAIRSLIDARVRVNVKSFAVFYTSLKFSNMQT